MPLPPRRPKSALIIANPVSGGGRAQRAAPALATALDRLGCRTEVYYTGRAGDARARAREAGSEDLDVLVAAGGDGTVAEVLDGMPDLQRPLAMLPIGTANVLALEYRLPRRTEQLAALITSGQLREHAIGRAGNRRFLLFCGAGIDGTVVRRLSEVRTGTLGKHKWLGPILHTAWHWPRYSLRAEFEDGEVLEELRSVLVTRVRNYGGVIHLVPEIDASANWLYALCFRHTGRVAWFWQGARAAIRTLRPSRKLLVRRTRALSITGNAPYQLDGDFGGDTPIDLSLEPAPVRLCAP